MRCDPARTSWRTRPTRAGWALGLGMLAGCGEPPPPIAVHDLESVVHGLADATGSPEAFASIFAQGTAADEALRERIQLLTFELAAPPVLTPNSATAQVNVFDGDGRPLGTVTWTFARENGAWKAQNLPVPAGGT